MKMRVAYRANAKLLRQNAGRILLFELFFTACTLCAGFAGVLWLWRLVKALSGYTLLSSAQTLAYMARPSVVVLLLVLAVGASFAGLVEALALVWCFEEGCHGRRAGLREMLATGVQGALRALRRKNWALVLFAAFFLPFAKLAAAGCFLAAVHIPGFVAAFVRNFWPLCVLGILGVLVLLLFLLRYSLAFHCFSLEGKDAREALRQSARLMKGRPWKAWLGFVLWQGLLLILALLAAAGLSALAVLAVKLLAPQHLAYAMALRAVYAVWMAVVWLALRFSAPFTFARLAGLYRARQAVAGAEDTGACPRPKPLPPLMKKALPVVLAWALLAFGLAALAERDEEVSLVKNLADQPAVMAHRGNSQKAPENTLPAFEKAMESGADWIELDVHQTKDGVLVVLHDENLKRVAGVDKNIWDLSYQVLQQYDVGAWFSPAYEGVRVPTLEEVLRLCKDKILLNIELKVTGHEQDFEKQVLEMVYAYGFEEDCVLASLNKEALQTVRELDANISTVYIMPAAPEDMETLNFASGLSVQANVMSWNVVDRAHHAEKRVYVWTVNRESSMQVMIDRRVDGLITNDPVRARELMEAVNLNGTLAQLIGGFF